MYAGRGLDKADRYDWVYGLVDADQNVRMAALARHHSLLAGWRPGTASGTLVDLTRAFVAANGRSAEDYRRFARYAVVFLQWELRFPADWRDGWPPSSPWSAKEEILAAFCAGGPTPETGVALVDLLLAAVHRCQRCQDRWYWRLARRLDSPDLRSRLAAAAGDADERTRLRARFVLWVVDHPEERVSSPVWRRWLRSEGRPVAVPAASDLAAKKPAVAASMLADLAPADVARVLEGLHAGPAARILAVMNPVELAARAAELMDVRMAARALKAMDQPTAAGVLAAMDASAAAIRFPGSSRPELLLLMDTDSAVARLRAMTPAAAGRRLEYLPPERAATLLTWMDSAFAVQALAGMGWWGPKRILTHMPPEIAAARLAQLRSAVPSRARQDLDFKIWTLSRRSN